LNQLIAVAVKIAPPPINRSGSVHPETGYFVLNQGALANVTAGIYIIFQLLNLTAQQRVKGKKPFPDGHQEPHVPAWATFLSFYQSSTAHPIHSGSAGE
jgi:hypothetical protein